MKKESEVLWLLMIDDDLFTYDTPLGETFNEFNRLSRMDDDLFTFELGLKYGNHETMDKKIKNGVIETWLMRSYKQQFNDYVEIKRKNDMFEHDTNMEYDPSDVDFAKWIALKFSNHSTMDWYIKNALRMYWIRGDD
nr:SGNH hydrolase-type esterase domain-containing protein [Tanacetum cinerariifolium]